MQDLLSLRRKEDYGMSYLGYDDYGYYMTKCVRDADGVWSVGEELDLERDFDGLRYKSFSGLTAYGEQRAVYTEEYAESDAVLSYVSSSVDSRSALELELVLYFFCPDATVLDFAGVYAGASAVYHSFVEYLANGYVLYRDTIRRRRVLMYLVESLEPSTDSVRGKAYIECAFKFSGVFGRSFGLDDTTLLGYLGLDSYPVYVG